MISDITPISFQLDDVMGQPIALRYLRNYTKNRDKIPPLLIFYGPSGVGKQFTADRFVKTVLCLEGTACGKCPSCNQFLKQTHPDYIEFPEGERIPIGEEKDPKEFSVRWLQTQRIVYSPMLSMYRIVLVPDATKINTEAETALLKTLEEAPRHTRFIFLVEDIRSLKSTITSRAVLVPFHYLPKETVQKIATEQDIYVHEYQGGSFQMNFIDPEVWELYTTQVKNSLFDSILIIQLESWIKEHKTKHPEWKVDFDYKRFLEMISSFMIFEYSKDQSKDWSEAIEAIYEFKEYLHKEINGMENFLISRLFGKLSLLLP
jgi:DNA polymerase III subunit gamma/tau